MERNEFLQLAISCPNATQGAHQGRFDFRIGGNIFATFDPKRNLGALSLLPEQQADLIARSTAFFCGQWRMGCTWLDQVIASSSKMSGCAGRVNGGVGQSRT